MCGRRRGVGGEARNGSDEVPVINLVLARSRHQQDVVFILHGNVNRTKPHVILVKDNRRGGTTLCQGFVVNGICGADPAVAPQQIGLLLLRASVCSALVFFNSLCLGYYVNFVCDFFGCLRCLAVNMPKIFLIKNRLHQQQLRLLEHQNAVQGKNDLGIEKSNDVASPPSPKPLSLIVPKKDGKSFLPKIEIFAFTGKIARSTFMAFFQNKNNNETAKVGRLITDQYLQGSFFRFLLLCRTTTINIDFLVRFGYGSMVIVN